MEAEWIELELAESSLTEMPTPEQLDKQIRDVQKRQTRDGERLARLEERSSGAKPENWLKRNSYWWSPCIALIGLAVGTGVILRFFTLTVNEQIDTKLKEPLKDISGQNVSLARIQTKLDDISELLKIITQNEMKRLGALPPAQFNKTLPEVKGVLSAALAERLPPDEAVKNIKSKLREIDHAQAGFWPAAAALISYQSATPSTDLASLDQANLPKCLDGPWKGDLAHIRFRQCEIALDDQRIGDLPRIHIEFVDCVVRYHGGKTIPFSALFVNCIFDLRLQSTPPAFGQKVTETLLAAEDLQHVDLRT